MASVFLSYDRDDADRARPLALALEKAGHSVWWDLLFAKRAGLLQFWQSSGKWPDFCNARDLPYDCKKEAAKLLA